MNIDVLARNAQAGGLEEAFKAIAAHLDAALVLADATGDRLLGAKISECVEHVQLLVG